MVIKIKRVNLKLSKHTISYWTVNANGNTHSSKNLFRAILKCIRPHDGNGSHARLKI